MPALVDLAAGPALAPKVHVFAGDVVEHKKPAPDIYRLCVDRLELDPARTVVVEDSRNGMLAALAAELACVVTVSAYTAEEDFAGASVVVTSLGDPAPQETVTEVLSDPLGLDPRPFVRLEHLERVLAAGGPGTGQH